LKKLLGFILISILTVTSVLAETITLAADQWPPFNGVPNSESEGYMVDVVREIFEKKGISVIYINVPWKRAVIGARRGTYTGIIGASKIDAEGFVFPKEELARNILAFYVKKGNLWRFHNLESIKEIRLGTVRGYDYREWLNEYIQKYHANSSKVQVLGGEFPLKRNLQKMLGGRIEVIVDNEAVILWEAKRLGILHEIESAGYGKETSHCYVAFSPYLHESLRYADLLSNGINELRKNGKLAVILSKYGLTDWKTQ